jgi:hypothetical protein
VYSTCLFCHGSLGTNEAVEHFPVGRRLAFDAARGRLWVVCGACDRWNLTPLEERWEAIEECERLFRGTPLRVSTDQIGLARVKEGLELVRIGSPLRPEMAAWRYGDQFGRRRNRADWTIAALAVCGIGALIGMTVSPFVAAPFGIALVGGGMMRAGARASRSFGMSRNATVLTPSPFGTLVVDEWSLLASRFVRRGASWAMHVQYLSTLAGRRDAFVLGANNGVFVDIHGHEAFEGGFSVELAPTDAIRALGVMTTMLNRSGGRSGEVEAAVGVLSDAGSATKFCDLVVAKTLEPTMWAPDEGALTRLPHEQRLALEMATNEEVERAVMDGELHDLEQRWKEAEEIAGIADALFTAPSVSRSLAEMKRATLGGNSTPPTGTNR